MNYPAASCGVSKGTDSRQNILSRQDAKNAKKDSYLFLRTWRTLRLCASHRFAVSVSHILTDTCKQISCFYAASYGELTRRD
jgi:hypothetical protein